MNDRNRINNDVYPPQAMAILNDENLRNMKAEVYDLSIKKAAMERRLQELNRKIQELEAEKAKSREG